MSTKPATHKSHFTHVEIFKGEKTSLGVGSYGAVYKAKCDDLTCAAKILHPVLFQSNDPGACRIMRHFERECDFMNDLKHPNIVLFLGVCRDLDSNLPVLLMELLDESLTKLLERSTKQLLFHTQLDICYDVALALSYLHTNKIVHRDLSSNNVLILAESRAKLSDFGMSKLMDSADMGTHSARTFCPGTEVYMPPESMKQPPLYTEKLDCFSFGVLVIQVLTCMFPSPGPRMKEIACVDSPTGTIDMPVLETERRNNHIQLADSTNPMLPIAISCLNYNPNDRPTSSNLCEYLSAIQTTSTYTTSRENSLMVRNHLVALEQVQKPKTTLSVDVSIPEQLVKPKKLMLNEREDLQVFKTPRQLHTVEMNATKDKDFLFEVSDVVEPCNQLDEVQKFLVSNQQLEHQLEEAQKCMCEKDLVISQQKYDISKLQQRLHETEIDLHCARKMLVKRETEIIDQRPRNLRESPQLSRHFQMISQPESSDTTLDLNLVETVSTKKNKAVCEMARGSTAVKGSMIYFRGAGSSEVYLYDTEKSNWSKLPLCPLSGFTLVMVDGILTAIGINESDCRGVDVLLCYSPSSASKGEWLEKFPVMLTKRYNPAAVYSKGILVVAGGNLETGEKSDTVEVMDAANQRWFVASKLPIPISQASAVVCNDSVYLVGGVDDNRKWVNFVQTCTIDDLNKHISKKRSHSKKKVSQWHLIANLPVCRATCAVLNDTLLAVGGISFSKGITSKIVYVYNVDGDFWDAVGQLAIARSQCLVASQRDKVVVVGGWVESNAMTDDIEMFDLK